MGENKKTGFPKIVLRKSWPFRLGARTIAKGLKKQFEAIVGTARIGVDVIDSDFFIVYIDPFWKKVYGDSRGKKCFNYFMGRYQPCPGCGIVEAIRLKKAIVSERILVEEGNRVVQVTAVPFQDENGNWLVAEVNVDITDRKKVEAALRESEGRYKRLLSSATDYIFTVKIVSGKPITTYHGPGCLAVTGYTQQEYDQDPHLWYQMIYEADRAAVLNQLTLATKGQSDQPLEHRITHKDGSICWVRNTIVVHRDEKSQITAYDGLITDITQRKMAEEALRQSEARYRALAETSHDSIFTVDRDGKFQYVNQSTCKMLNRPREEIISRRLDELFSHEDALRYFRDIQQVFQTGQSLNAVSAPEVSSGPLWLDTWLIPLKADDEQIKLVLGVSRDVTDRIKAQEALQKSHDQLEDLVDKRTAQLMKANEDLRESQRRQKALLDGIPDLAWMKDQQSRFIAVNQRFADTCGFGADKLVGKTDYDIWPKEMAELYVADDREVINGGKIKRVEEPLINRSGVRIWIETVKVPILNDHGQVIGTVGIARDISERRRAEMVLRQSHAELERLVKERTGDLEKLNEGLKAEIAAHQAARREREHLMKELEQKNKELEGVIYVASHDLRSPLVNIQGFSKIMEKNYHEMLQIIKCPDQSSLNAEQFAGFASKISKNVHFITTSVHKMDALIDGLLRVSRIGLAELHVEDIEMNQVLKNVIESMTYQIHQVAATVEISRVPACRGDKMQVNQVFSNLIDNAIKYRDTQRPLKIRISGEDRQDHSVYCVEDNGIGIADEHQDKIWELFHRLNPNGDVTGEGLGLTMVRRIVDRNNGWVWVEAKAGVGSRFFVALPNAVAQDDVPRI